MDWSKSKNILIIVFIVLNLFLLYNVYQKESKTILVSQNEIKDIKTILKSNKYELNANLPAKITPKNFLEIEDLCLTK
jgi:regulatory protein YycI of two-component signal transduction system YycFG